MDEFLSWLAGFYEGEGGASLAWSGKAPERKYIMISIAQSHLGILQLIQDKMGGQIITRRIELPSHSPSWRLRWNGAKAREFAKRIRPFMRHAKKIEQLERMLRLSLT